MATLDPEFDLRLRGALTAGKEAGRGLNVISGYRSPADQARAINSVSLNVNKRPASFMDYARGIKGYAAPVGGSMHQKGLAADLEGDVPWMREHAKRYGLRFPDSLSKTDPNHVEIDPNAWGPFQDPRDRGSPSVTVPQSMGGVVGMLGPAPGSFRAAQGDQPAKSAAPAVAGMTQGAPPMAGAGMLGTWTPDEVNARRRMASGMIQEGMNSAPVQHWTQGLARVIGGLSGNMWMDQANQAEREGRASAAQTMQAAMDNPNPRAGVGGMLGNVWTQDQGQKLATGMLSNEIQSQTPDAKLARQLKEAQLKRAMEPPSTDDIREFEYAKNNGFTGGFQDWMKQKRDMNGQTAQQITWGTDDKGNYVPMQASRDGKLVASQLPPNVTPVPAEVLAYRKAAATEQGQGAGKARVDLPAVRTNANMMFDAIDAIEKDENLPAMTSGLSAWLPNVTEKSRASQSRVDQVQGKAFLQAYAGLRGGGAITEAEGAKATASLSRLQELRVGTPEYKQALADLRREIKALVALAEQKAAMAEPNAPVRPSPHAAPAPADAGGWSLRRLD